MHLLPLNEEHDAAWDALGSTTPESGFMQSSAWAAFKRAEGYRTARLGLFEQGRLVGGASLFTYPSSAEAGFVLCPEGPVLPWDDVTQARAGLRAIIGAALELPGFEDAIG